MGGADAFQRRGARRAEIAGGLTPERRRLGGMLTGLGIVFRASARNSPILGRYVDTERLRADCAKLRD